MQGQSHLLRFYVPDSAVLMCPTFPRSSVVFESPQRSPQLLGESAVDDSEDEDSPANPSAQPFGTFPRSATRGSLETFCFAVKARRALFKT